MALLRSKSAPKLGSSLVGASTNGAPLRHLPTIFAAISSSSSRDEACSRRYFRNAATLVWNLRNATNVPLRRNISGYGLVAVSPSSSGYPITTPLPVLALVRGDHRGRAAAS